MIENPDYVIEPSIEEQKAMSDPEPAQVVEIGGVKIERGIPIPDAIGGRKTGSKHDPVLAAMNPGDSILFTGDTMDRDVNSFLRVAKKREMPMSTRKVVENGHPGIRVWRRPE